MAWLTKANLEVGCYFLWHGLPEPRHTGVVTALATMVTSLAVPQWVVGVPLSPVTGFCCVSIWARLTVVVMANKAWSSIASFSSTGTVVWIGYILP